MYKEHMLYLEHNKCLINGFNDDDDLEIWKER